MTESFYHTPALLYQSIRALDIRPAGVYVDATLGGGGHSAAILDALGAEGRLVAFDQDEDAINRARARMADDSRLTLVHGNFRYLTNYLRLAGIETVDGILADLGVSSHHFDEADRGFSFRFDGPLDMRMNRRARLSAAQWIAETPQERIEAVMRSYGELRQARRIAAAIVEARRQQPVDTIEGLLQVVRPLVSPKSEKKELAQVFQAIRIEINGELTALRRFLEQAAATLRPGARLAVITYHSLEDRLVKNFMRAGNFEGTVHTDLFGRSDAPLRPLGSKPIVPTREEVELNPRARSAKLRVAAKIATS